MWHDSTIGTIGDSYRDSYLTQCCCACADELTDELARSRAAELLDVLSRTIEENAILKITNASREEDGHTSSTTRSQLEIAMKYRKSKVDALQVAVAEGVGKVRSLTSTLRAMATCRKPLLQLLYLQAAVKTTGEVFDVTCFAGISQYHCLRVHGECSHSHLSSCHLRCTDFELACQPEEGDARPKEAFMRNTHGMFMQCLVYASSIHLAWAAEDNHELISLSSACTLQCTRADLDLLRTVDVDPAAHIVTVILDVVTDKQHFHVAAASLGATPPAFSVTGAMKCMDSDDTSGHEVEPQKVAELAAELAALRGKDLVPHAHTAAAIVPLADRCHALGKELHLLLLGCNTIQLVPFLKAAIAKPECVTVLCTSEVWPSDCSVMLWHLYGALAQTGGMDSFRAGTRTLLGEYTDHYKRQRIQDESRAELMLEGSLGNAVHCSRLDRVKVCPGKLPDMDLL